MTETNEEARRPGATARPNASNRLFTGVFIAIIGVTLTCYIVGQGLNAGTSVYINRLGGTATLAGIGFQGIGSSELTVQP